MAETPSTTIRIPPDLGAEIDARIGSAYGEGRSSILARDALRYYLAIRDALADVTLTEPQASLICDALNGTWLSDYASPLTPSRARVSLVTEVTDAIRLNGLDDKWEVDGTLLVSILSQLTPFECVAVIDAVERFWRDPQRDTGEMLREVGLVRDKPAKAAPAAKRKR